MWRTALYTLLFYVMTLGHAFGQAFPSKPITFIVPFPPGGVTDPVARLVGQKMSESIGQPIIVDNRPGGAGIIASQYVKQRPADGYTLLFGFTGSHAANPSLYAKLPYDPVKDFQPLTTLVWTQHVLVVPASSPAKSVADLVATAKTTGVSFASQGIGAGGHILGEMLKAKTGANFSHVPYKGSAPAVQDIMAGNVDMLFDAVVTSLPHIKTGKMKALAVASPKRSPHLPDVPTMAEGGFPGIELDQWFGMFVLAGTPQPIVKMLQAELVKAVTLPDVSKRFTDQGLDVVTQSPEEFASLIQADTAKLGAIIKQAGIKAE
jgi:tripartite-type tricarboxylate transporter receptor subunit TctC